VTNTEPARRINAGELRLGDFPIGLAGFYPITKIKIGARTKRVVFWAGGRKYGGEMPIYTDTLVLTKRKAS